MHNDYDVIIVGGGPGGYAAALYTARAGLSTLLFEEQVAGGQMSTTSYVENYPGFDEAVGGFDLALKMQAGAERFGAKTIYSHVQTIDFGHSASDTQVNKKAVHTAEGIYTCDALILAMGASPRKMGLPDEQRFEGHGLSYCATCDGPLFRDKTVAVAGGGNSAAAAALALAALCKQVYLLHRGPAMAAEQESLKQIDATENIHRLAHTQITVLHGEDRLQAVTIETDTPPQTRQLAVDGLFVAIGRQPNTTLCHAPSGGVALDADGYILAQEDTLTNLPGVFAVGDIRTKPLRQIITAAADGATAAIAAVAYLRNR